VLGDGQKLEVSETHLHRIGNQFRSKLVPVQPAVAFFGLAAPRGQVDFVDRDRRFKRIGVAALFCARHHRWQGSHDAGRGGPQFSLPRVRVRLQWQQVAAGIQQFELIAFAHPNARYKKLPHTTFATQAHPMPSAVPSIEVPHHANA
jgi:hypothetical protein